MEELVRKTVAEFISIKNRINEVKPILDVLGYENARKEYPELVDELYELLGVEHQYASLENLTEILNSEEKIAALAVLTEMAVQSSIDYYQENEYFRYEINKEQLAKEIVREILGGGGMFNPNLSDDAVKYIRIKEEVSDVNEEKVSEESAIPAKKGFWAFLKKIF